MPQGMGRTPSPQAGGTGWSKAELRGRAPARRVFKEVVLTRHRLMLSAAAAAMVAAALVAAGAAQADTEISTGTSTALSTSSAGNITVDSGGSIAIGTSNVAPVTLNSNNSVTNNGSLANGNVDNGIGVQIDTTNGSILSGSGFTSTGIINLSGNGTAKRGVWITGGHTFYGPVTLTSLTGVTSSGSAGIVQSSTLTLTGDSSAAFVLDQGTSVTSNILLGGTGITQSGSVNSTNTGSIIVYLNGTVNGNVYNAAPINGVGASMIGVEVLGGIHSCASDTANFPSGFTCPTSSGGSFINAGNIQLVGTTFPNSRGGNVESGSAVVIGNAIDGGFVNAGPGTSSNVTAAIISSAGVVSSSAVSPVLLIDPTQSITSTTTSPRGPAILGPVTPDVDSTDAGYSFINRGTIHAQALDPQISSSSVVIEGASSTYYTCLSASVGSCDTGSYTRNQNVTDSNGVTRNVAYTARGGLLNTGTISAVSVTNLNNTSSISATALHIGDYATVPNITVLAETISGSTTTPGTINASVSGVGGGSAFALSMSTQAKVPEIDVGKGASIVASVQTNTVAPDKSIATSTSPFTLFSTAILDQSGTLKTVNNAGTIQASTTTLVPQAGATTATVTRAIDLQSASTGSTTINNSGSILGDVLFAPAGGSNIFNVGNVNPAGTLNVINTTANYAVVAQSIIANVASGAPLTNAALIDFGSGTGNQLNVGGYGYVNADIHTAAANALDINVAPNGQLFVASNTVNLPNDNNTLQVRDLTVQTGGTLGLSITQNNLSALTPVVQAGRNVDLSGATLALQFGSYISTAQGTPQKPVEQTITLVRSAGTLVDNTLGDQNARLGQNTPFLFESPASAGIVAGDNGPAPLSLSSDSSGQQVLQLHLLPRSVGATNADGSPGLNLSGDAANQFPFVTRALATDPQLGAAVATSMTIYNTPGQPGSGINVKASQQQAEQVFSQFAPDTSGGTREIAIMLTDQATGPVAARQRLLRSYGNVSGDMTLWGEEFTGHINNKGDATASGTTVSFKDHGFGFAVGVDAGGPRTGWFGGAFTFYSGDVDQLLPRATRTQTEWYMLTGYTDWRGKHVFLDTQLSAAYGNFTETRSIAVGNITRDALSKRPGVMLAGGVNMGLITHVLGGIEIDPHVSLDGLTLREEGYTENNGGSGFDLDVAPYFANSLRTAVGADIKGTVTIWGIGLTPEGRVGYRYDLLQQPVKIRAGFDSTGGLGQTGNTMVFTGPDPSSGNVFGGLSLNAGTDTWSLGINYDWVRGDNNSTTQVGTITVLGRI